MVGNCVTGLVHVFWKCILYNINNVEKAVRYQKCLGQRLQMCAQHKYYMFLLSLNYCTFCFVIKITSTFHYWNFLFKYKATEVYFTKVWRGRHVATNLTRQSLFFRNVLLFHFMQNLLETDNNILYDNLCCIRR